MNSVKVYILLSLILAAPSTYALPSFKVLSAKTSSLCTRFLGNKFPKGSKNTTMVKLQTTTDIVDRLVDDLLHRELLATLAGIKPVSLIVKEGKIIEDGVAVKLSQDVIFEIEDLRNYSDDIGWITVPSKKGLTIYAYNNNAVKELLKVKKVQNILSQLGKFRPDLDFNADGFDNSYEVMKSFEIAQLFWFNRGQMFDGFGLDGAEVMDYHVLSGLLYGYEPTDVLKWGRNIIGRAKGDPQMYQFYADLDFNLGAYATFNEKLSPQQIQYQALAKGAVEKYRRLIARGMSPIEIFRQWNRLK